MQAADVNFPVFRKPANQTFLVEAYMHSKHANPIIEVCLCIFSLLISSSVVGQISKPKCSGDKGPVENGSIAVSVTANAYFLNVFNSVKIARFENGKLTNKICQLDAIAPETSLGTKYFSGQVPAGEYKFFGFDDYNNAGNNNDTFKVEAGQHSDLGRMLFSASPQRPQWVGTAYAHTGRSKKILGNAQFQRFNKQTEIFDTHLLKDPWIPSGLPESNIEDYVLANPIGFETAMAIGHGMQAVRAGVGGIWIMSDTDNRWDRVATHNMEIILDIRPAYKVDNSPIAVGELNFMAFLDSSRKWRNIETGNLPMGNILFLEGNAVTGWHVFHQIGSEISVYHSKTLESGNWIKVRSEISQPLTLPSYIKSFWLWRTNNGFGYAVSSGNIYFYNIESGLWTSSYAPEEARIVDLKSSGNNIGILTYPGGKKDASAKFVYGAGIRGKAFVSIDQAQTWKRLNPPKKVMRQAPFVGSNGKLLFSATGITAASPIYMSLDAGITWSGTTQEYDSFIYISEPSEKLYATGPFEIFSSADNGKTWLLEHRSQ